MADSPQPDTTAQVRAEEEPGARMSFFEHLVDLRKRIINSLIAIGVGMVVGFLLSERLVGFIVRPMTSALREAHLGDKLIYTHPAGYLNLLISFGVYSGIVMAMPVVLYQIWQFVAPGLYKHERRAVTGFIFFSTVLFLVGIAFGYFIMLPYVLRFLVSFKGPVEPLISINEYFDLILLILLGLGLVFETPILIFFLALFGIVTPKMLLKNFRYAMLVITIVAAIVTPTPDATTMLIFMAPMVLLYFAGVLVSYVVLRRKQSRALARGEAH
jgi:sec-independent protein translocase protein TatC